MKRITLTWRLCRYEITHTQAETYEILSCSDGNNNTMKRTLTSLLIIALAVGTLVSLATPVAAQPELLLQIEEFGPLLELIVRLFDISISIEG